jgi:hypothetical protein
MSSMKSEIAAAAAELIDEWRRREGGRSQRKVNKSRGPLPSDLSAAPVHKAAIELLCRCCCPPTVVNLFKVILDVQDEDETPSLTETEMNAAKLDAASEKPLTNGQIARKLRCTPQAVRKMRSKPEYQRYYASEFSKKVLRSIESNDEQTLPPEVMGARTWQSYDGLRRLLEVENYYLTEDWTPMESPIDGKLYLTLREYAEHVLESGCVPAGLLKNIGNRETGN